ncbi:MAG: hypothetical protein SynsKO_13710 [Synoicihabitans sp.]
MVSRFINLFFATALLLLFSGCEFWNVGGSAYQAPKGAFSMRVPAEWSYSTQMGAAELVATRDGLNLQSIEVRANALDEALPHTGRELSGQLASFELAEAVADDLRSDPDRYQFSVIKNEPATIDGKSGFKLTTTFRSKDQLLLRQTRYGVIHGDKLWTLAYTAPHRHYHDRDLDEFEAVVAAFKFGTGSQS